MIQAVLWDMDGLMIDSEPLWTIAETELATSLGGTWTHGIKALVVGHRLDVAVPAILGFYDIEPTPARVAEASTWMLARMVELFTTQKLPLLPGVAELLKAVDAAGVPMALVSSSSRLLVDAVLGQGIGPFAVTVAGDEVVDAKPAPEPYLTAAAHLGVDPARCVVLEDSPAGIASGEAAGCAVVAVPSVLGVNVDSQPRRLVRTTLTGLDVDTLHSLV